MIYLDNASTTRKKPNSVLKALISGITKYSANPGRSGHKLSLDAAIEIAKTRELLKNYFGASKMENVIFTSGCTESLNLAILGTAKQGGHVIATTFEHNSVLRPLFELEKNNIIELTIVEPEDKHKITKKGIKILKLLILLKLKLDIFPIANWRCNECAELACLPLVLELLRKTFDDRQRRPLVKPQ